MTSARSLVMAIAMLASCDDASLEPSVARSWAVGPYPVDPRVHVEDDSLDATDPGSIDASILNAPAYARHALELALGTRVDSEEPAEILAGIVEASHASSIPPERWLAYAQAVPSEDELATAWAAMNEHARGGSSEAPIPRSIERSLQAVAQREACQADGYGAKNCCKALLLPAAVLDEPATWSPELLGHLQALVANAPGAADALAQEQLAEDPEQPFELLGLKAWASACAAEVAYAPVDLEVLRARVGDWQTWPSELHPVSMAKLAGRRIYRHGNTAIAESLAADCSVRETEVVRRHPDGRLDMWTFDGDGVRALHGYFPAAPDRDTIKVTPDACMGCHYTFDTRRFEVQIPSWRALQLELRAVGGVPVWRDDSACARPGEPIVWHEHP